MNAGFSNLASLKAQLLAPALVPSTDFDARILSLGLGVAAALENFCNRKFARMVNAMHTLPADRVQFLLNRYPVESLAQYELKQNEQDGFVVQDITNILTIDNDAGIVMFPDQADLGKSQHQVRFTFTGGYWWEQLEPADVGYPTAQPAGSTALPADLQTAWFLQCKRVWESLDKIGDKIANVGPGDKEARFDIGIGGVDLAPLVKQMLQQFVRMNLT